MRRAPTPLPNPLGPHFSVASAAEHGVKRGRLRGADLEAPFYGIRMLQPPAEYSTDRAAMTRHLAHAYSHRMRAVDVFSNETAAALLDAPLPFSTDMRLHVATIRPANAPRTRGVVGHSVAASGIITAAAEGLSITDPATTWAMLGESLDVPWLVAVGDHLCRVWRAEGYYRPNAGKPPLATLEQLADAAARCRRRGIAKLREALPLVRCDSWSPRESLTRYEIVTGGLPDPVLNRDFYDDYGGHLACLDMAYEEYKVAVEYQGRVHGVQYSRDIERLERLRAAGWIVVQVSSELLKTPHVLVRRVRDALRSRGWRG